MVLMGAVIHRKMVAYFSLTSQWGPLVKDSIVIYSVKEL